MYGLTGKRKYLLTNVPCHNYHLPYKTKTCITMWKLKTTAKGNFIYVSRLKQQGNSDFEFISVSFSAVTVIYVTNIQFR